MNGEPEIFPLDDAAVKLIAELQQEIDQRAYRMNGILTYFMRVHGLQGNWMLAPNGRELVREPQRLAAPVAAAPAAE